MNTIPLLYAPATHTMVHYLITSLIWKISHPFLASFQIKSPNLSIIYLKKISSWWNGDANWENESTVLKEKRIAKEEGLDGIFLKG